MKKKAPAEPQGPLTAVQRQLAYVERKRASGLKQLHNFWAHPDDIEEIKEFAARLQKRRERAAKA